jgi:hypothetical protein
MVSYMMNCFFSFVLTDYNLIIVKAREIIKGDYLYKQTKILNI